MAYNRGERPDSPMKRRGGRRRKKVCVFCGKENNESNIAQQYLQETFKDCHSAASLGRTWRHPGGLRK